MFTARLPTILLLSIGISLLIGCSKTETDKLAVPIASNIKSAHQDKNAFIVINNNGSKLRITAYGDQILRLQSARSEEAFFEDNHYEMVQSHDIQQPLHLTENDSYIEFSTKSANSSRLRLDKQSLALSFYQNNQKTPVLTQSQLVQWQQNNIISHFKYDSNEHFTGLGHGFFGREQSLDLKGKTINRNYGTDHGEQAPLIVPFYMSSKGYGLFLNSTFSNQFNFGNNNQYSVSINDSGFSGRMDYFFIAGPKLKTVLDRYTQLTGRPRLPMKSMFGLQLSDKGHDHNSPTPSDENWWKNKITQHRNAGFALDHVINDNRWRAAGGKRCESKLEWDKERYPDPAEYAKWLVENGLVATLDLNRCIAQFSEGWKAEFNLPDSGKIDFAQSAPDLTNQQFRDWFWQIFYNKSLNPKLQYPGSALWIDEFDEQGAVPKNMILANGKSSAEMRNYWFFLIAKALVQQGWDKSDINKRPFVWVRGMTAGAQRYATLWSGDIKPTYADMKTQIRAMQLAGLSGFPYWGHDAGGFHDWESHQGPDDNMYIQWSMAMGSFAPIWKPHGMGESRWPLDRPQAVQQQVSKYMKLRYELMPYLYTAAHQAASTGLPMARAMLLDYQDSPQAWKYDLQYMWGDSLLVAPNTADSGQQEVWLPTGNWYAFNDHQLIKGGLNLSLNSSLGALPIYVKQGAIITKRNYAQSTAFIDKQKLVLDIYVGANGETTLIEDDDVTEGYRLNNEKRTTLISFDNDNFTTTIYPAQGSYRNAKLSRSYQINFFGASDLRCLMLNGKKLNLTKNNPQIKIESVNLDQKIIISACD